MSDTTSSNLLDSVRRHLARSMTKSGVAEVGDRLAIEYRISAFDLVP